MYKIKKIKLWTRFWISEWICTKCTNSPVVLHNSVPKDSNLRVFHPLFALFASHSSISYLQVKTPRAIEWHTIQCIMDQNSIDQKKASVSISTQNLPALGILNVLKTPHALAWSSLEIVQFITQWVLSLHGLSFSLWSLKRAVAGRPIGTRELLARPMRALHFLNSPPIVWPSVGGPSRREQGGTLPLVYVKGSFRDKM